MAVRYEHFFVSLVDTSVFLLVILSKQTIFDNSVLFHLTTLYIQVYNLFTPASMYRSIYMDGMQK